MERNPHLERFVPRGNERQIISDRGVPVKISTHPESRDHADKVTLSVGGIMRLGELEAPALREEARLTREINDTEIALQQKAIAALTARHPDFDAQAWDSWPIIQEEMSRLLAEDPATRDALAENRTLRETLRKTRYSFNKERDKDELIVGKEGALVYSIQGGEGPAYELAKSLAQHQEYARDHNDYVHDAALIERIATMQEKLASATRVADIHQVEVLPEHQGKGIAGALLDAALWELEHNAGVDFTVARILGHNPDGKKMLRAFEKAGFTAFGCSHYEVPGREYTLVVRKNPYKNSKIN